MFRIALVFRRCRTALSEALDDSYSMFSIGMPAVCAQLRSIGYDYKGSNFAQVAMATYDSCSTSLTNC